MAYLISTPAAGLQPVGTVSTTQRAPLGTRVNAVDPVYGEGEFVYLKGAPSTVVGSVVIFDQYAATTTLTVAGSRGPVAIATAATVTNTFGWYQISGAAVAQVGTVVANANVYVTATPGLLDDAVVATDKIDGFRFKTANGTPSAGLAVCQINNAALNGNG